MSMLGSFGRSRSRSVGGKQRLALWSGCLGSLLAWAHTLLAGFALSFSKSLSDCCFVARPLILSVKSGDGSEYGCRLAGFVMCH